jgi:hypothetical protein
MINPYRRPPVAWLPVGAVAAVVAALLLATANAYGYHRDELYFRVLGQHPAWGYIDQPPATPLLTRLAIAVFGDSVWGLRVPGVLCAVAAAFLIALIAREVGGGPVAQALAACGATRTFGLAFGHLFITASVDAVVWLLAILFAFRALLRDQPRWWLAVGAVSGAGLYNKHLIILLLLALAGGLLLVGPRRVLRSPWLWAGAGLAVLIGAPNLIYQVTHDFPQLKMAEALRENKGGDSMVLLLPFQLVAIGLPLVPIMIAGIVRLLRDPSLRPVRAFAVAYLLLIAALFGIAGQPHYNHGPGPDLACGRQRDGRRMAGRPDRATAAGGRRGRGQPRRRGRLRAARLHPQHPGQDRHSQHQPGHPRPDRLAELRLAGRRGLPRAGTGGGRERRRHHRKLWGVRSDRPLRRSAWAARRPPLQWTERAA